MKFLKNGTLVLYRQHQVNPKENFLFLTLKWLKSWFWPTCLPTAKNKNNLLFMNRAWCKKNSQVKLALFVKHGHICTGYLLSNRDVSAENNLAATYNLEDPILQTEGRFYLITKSRPDCYMKEKDGWIWLDTLHLFSKIWFWVAFYGAWLQPSGCSELSFFLMLSWP